MLAHPAVLGGLLLTVVHIALAVRIAAGCAARLGRDRADRTMLAAIDAAERTVAPPA